MVGKPKPKRADVLEVSKVIRFHYNLVTRGRPEGDAKRLVLKMHGRFGYASWPWGAFRPYATTVYSEQGDFLGSCARLESWC